MERVEQVLFRQPCDTSIQQTARIVATVATAAQAISGKKPSAPFLSSVFALIVSADGFVGKGSP